MKKVLFIVAVCILSLNSLAERGLSATSSTTSESLEFQQSSNWEYLGNSDYYRCTNQRAGTGSIYVRIISGRTFYQIRIKKYDGSIDCFSISLGDYNVRGRKYNAKFSATIFPDNGQDYYLNL